MSCKCDEYVEALEERAATLEQEVEALREQVEDIWNSLLSLERPLELASEAFEEMDEELAVVDARLNELEEFRDRVHWACHEEE